MSKDREMAKYILRSFIQWNTMEPLTKCHGSRRTNIERDPRYRGSLKTVYFDLILINEVQYKIAF